jgi:hypothetical protein
MTFTEITFEYCQGKVFVCKPKIDDLEIELDSKMKGKIVGVSQPDEDDVVLVVIDTSDFVDHNNFYAKKTYYKGAGHLPGFTAREGGWWPEDEKHNVYFMANDLVEDYFEEVV